MALTPVAERPMPTGKERADEVLGEAEEFRKEALEAIPEAKE
jgi:hypothetical protein